MLTIANWPTVVHSYTHTQTHTNEEDNLKINVTKFPLGIALI